ncbi:hypothetical protein BSLG_006774 [Batrachochytrium salamandrivorans]|nr:hypothetical protein BSLG_006774 [Batrachochytrium salamandrivorans]
MRIASLLLRGGLRKSYSPHGALCSFSAIQDTPMLAARQPIGLSIRSQSTKLFPDGTEVVTDPVSKPTQSLASDEIKAGQESKLDTYNILASLQTNIPAPRLRFGASTATEKEQRDSTSGDLLGLFSSGFMSSQISTMVHILHITANRNNTIATFTDDAGKTLCWASAGTCGLKKAARGTSDAGYQAVLALTEKVKERNIPISDGVHLRISGFGPGREQAFRAVRAAGWSLVRITDFTPYRHAGCRPKKKRRL